MPEDAFEWTACAVVWLAFLMAVGSGAVGVWRSERRYREAMKRLPTLEETMENAKVWLRDYEREMRWRALMNRPAEDVATEAARRGVLL